jgi:carboxylesterase type B
MKKDAEGKLTHLIGRQIWLPSLLVALLLAAASQAQAQTCTTATINTPSGPYCGIVSKASGGSVSANAFLGIRYARQPGRWQVAQPADPFISTYPAVRYGNVCPQAALGGGRTQSSSLSASEDCLFLNLWAPMNTVVNAKLPVKVFIHGGAFIEGAGSSPLYDGTGLAATQKVIIVTFNYRLGALGFLALDGITDSTNNNFGFRDQILALQWVKKNAASFGGDPENVTLWGESAGAMSVGLHALSSTQSASLFQAAVMESNPLGLPYKTYDQAEAAGKTFADVLLCFEHPQKRAECLRNKSVDEILKAEESKWLSSPLFFRGDQWSLVWTPAIDQGNWSNPLFLGQPLDGTLNVPMLFGTNRDEGILFVAALMKSEGWEHIDWFRYYGVLSETLGRTNAGRIQAHPGYKCATFDHCEYALVDVFTDFLFSCPNRYLGMKTAQPKLWAYLFTQVSSFNLWPNVRACKDEVCHGDELPYVFNTPSAACSGCSFEPSELGLSKAMGDYWASFDKSHAPAGTGGPWSVFGASKSYLQLQVSPKNVIDPLGTAANCAFWDEIGYESDPWNRALARFAD